MEGYCLDSSSMGFSGRSCFSEWRGGGDRVEATGSAV